MAEMNYIYIYICNPLVSLEVEEGVINFKQNN